MMAAGYYQFFNKEYQAAEESFQSVIDRQPELPEAWIAEVRCLHEWAQVEAAKGKQEEAAKKENDVQQKLKEALEKVKPESRPYVHAECLKALDKFDDAVAVYREAVKAHPETIEILKPAAEFFMLSAATQQDAQAILERCVSGTLKINQATMQWARRNLAGLLAGRSYTDRRRAIELTD